LAEVFLGSLAGDAFHGGLTELGREILVWGIGFLEFDNTEESVAKSGVMAGDETSELVFVLVFENPLVDPPRSKDCGKRGSEEKNEEAGERRGGDEAVEEKDKEEGDEEANEASDDRFGNF